MLYFTKLSKRVNNKLETNDFAPAARVGGAYVGTKSLSKSVDVIHSNLNA